jgi:hypothetical protein
MNGGQKGGGGRWKRQEKAQSIKFMVAVSGTSVPDGFMRRCGGDLSVGFK